MKKQEKKIIIIAEAGVNHNASMEMARKMVVEAAKAGADYVKFQTSGTRHFIHSSESRISEGDNRRE